VDYLNNLRFSQTDIDYLTRMGYPQDFLDYLAQLEMTLTVDLQKKVIWLYERTYSPNRRSFGTMAN
jgi:nicotinic acid phosphoribosyltransferase